MLQDPIVIRKSKGNLIVGSTVSKDPVQLVRQLNSESLEVHLKNGHTYTENISPDNLQETVLELMGYETHTFVIEFRCWAEDQKGTLSFPKGVALRNSGALIVERIFSETPYLNSKLVSISMKTVETRDIPYNGDTYSRYDVSAKIEMRCRVDMVAEIIDHLYDCSEIFCEPLVNDDRRWLHNNAHFSCQGFVL